MSHDPVRSHPSRMPRVASAYRAVARALQRAACPAAIAVLAVGRPVQAQIHPQVPDTVQRLMEPVTASVAQADVRSSASVLVIDVDSAEARPALSLADMLRVVPLVRIRDNSRGETHVALRGSESRQVSVSLDGIPLSIGWDNRTDLSVVPLSGVTRVTAVRGLSSLLAGPNVLGGVVQVEVAPAFVPREAPGSLRARAGVGTGGALATDLSGQQGIRAGGGEGLLHAGGGYRRWDYRPTGGSVSQPPPAVPGERLNSDLEQWNAFVAGRFQGGSGRWLGFSSMAFGARRGVAPELHVSEPRLWRLPVTRRWVTVLGAGLGWQAGDVGAGAVSLRGAMDVGRFEIDEYDSPAYRVVSGREAGDDRTLTLKADAQQSLAWGELAVSVTGVDTRHDEVFDAGPAARYRQRLFSGAAELAFPVWIRPNGGDLGLLVGASMDGSDTPETGGRASRDPIWDWGGKVAATLELPALRGRAHAGISRRTRAPSLREFYSGALGRFVVNPALGPETLLASEIGVMGGGAETRWQVVGFRQLLDHGIVRTSTGDGRFQRVNRDRILATGLELIGSVRWAGVMLEGDLTLQDVGLEDPGAPADEREPEYQPPLAMNLAVGGRLPADLTARLRVSYVGRQYCVHPDLSSDVRLDDAAWAGIELGRSWSFGSGPRARTLTVTGGIHNLTDASVYDQCGLPGPGRGFTLAVGVE